MWSHRILWLSCCAVLGVAGAAVGFATAPGAVAVLFLVLGVVGSVSTLSLGDAFWDRAAMGRLRLLARGALVPGIGVAAFVGYGSLLGAGVLLLAAGVLAASPYAVDLVSRLTRSVRTPSAAKLDAVARALASTSPESARVRTPGLRDLTDEQLCKRWRASYRAVRRQTSAVKVIAGVAERQVYLDELERRNRAGFAAWLAAGPQAAENPLPYLTGDDTETPAVDWDELIRGQG